MVYQIRPGRNSPVTGKAQTAPVEWTFLVNKGGTAEAPSLATGAFFILKEYGKLDADYA